MDITKVMVSSFLPSVALGDKMATSIAQTIR